MPVGNGIWSLGVGATSHAQKRGQRDSLCPCCFSDKSHIFWLMVFICFFWPRTLDDSSRELEVRGWGWKWEREVVSTKRETAGSSLIPLPAKLMSVAEEYTVLFPWHWVLSRGGKRALVPFSAFSPHHAGLSIWHEQYLGEAAVSKPRARVWSPLWGTRQQRCYTVLRRTWGPVHIEQG